MPEALLLIFAALVMLPGFLGVVLPAIPGIPYMFLIALGFGLIDGFTRLLPGELGILFAIMLISLVVDYSAGILGARLGGASRKATLAGIIGLVLGLILAPPLGGFLGMFLGVLYVEIKSGTVQKALKAASGSLLGSLAGIVINTILAIAFLLVFILLSLS